MTVLFCAVTGLIISKDNPKSVIGQGAISNVVIFIPGPGEKGMSGQAYRGIMSIYGIFGEE